MINVSFSEERKGYNKEEVEQYINLIQKNYQEVEEEYDLMEGTLKEVQENNEKLMDDNKRLSLLLEELELSTTKIQNDSNRWKKELEEARKLKLQNNDQEVQEQEQKINQLSQELEVKNRELELKERELEKALKLKEYPKPDVSEANEFSELYKEAQKQVEAYQNKIKLDAEKIIVEAKEEKAVMLEKAHEEAAEIVETAKKKEFDEYTEKLKELDRAKKEFEDECVYIRKELEVEVSAGKEEAIEIEHRAERKLKLAEEREQVMIAKTQRKVERIEEDLKQEREEMHLRLTDAANRLIKMYEFLDDLENTTDISMISQYIIEGGEILKRNENADIEKSEVNEPDDTIENAANTVG